LALNPTFDIKLVPFALGAATEERRALVYDDAQFRGVEGVAGPRMRVVTLDSVAVEHDLLPDLVKIDVEGMELAVLRGATNALHESVSAIMLEVHAPMLPAGESVEEIQRLVQSAGFDVFTPEFERVTDLARYVASEREVTPGVIHAVCKRSKFNR
jgi:hypothetical protein